MNGCRLLGSVLIDAGADAVTAVGAEIEMLI